MVQLLTQFGAESSGISALGLDGKALIIQLITLLLAYFVLRRYAFEPIGRVLRERRETIEKGVKLGEEMQKERAELDKQVDARLQAARKQADGIVAEAEAAARQTQRDAEDKAREKADGIVADAHVRAEQDTKNLRKALEKELIGLVSEATEAIIDEKVDASKDAALIDRALHARSAGGGTA